MPISKTGVLLLLSAILSLAACGQTGDLYLPDEKKTERR
ncbi:MAG: LPS translocon maturation chaperone LptM [Gammaproteobacteria bacterium]